MLNGNGHHNGHANGKAMSFEDDPHHRRQNIKTICSAILQGWLAELNDPAKMAEAIAALRDVLADPKTRPGTKTMAAKALAEALNQTLSMGLKLMEFEDKVDRLDRGDVTERHGYLVMNIEEARPSEGRMVE